MRPKLQHDARHSVQPSVGEVFHQRREVGDSWHQGGETDGEGDEEADGEAQSHLHSGEIPRHFHSGEDEPD